MKARIIISIVFILVCGSVFSQTKKETYTWAGIENRTVSECRKHSMQKHKKDDKAIYRQLQKHTRIFIRRWRNSNLTIGKATIKRIFENIEVYYVPLCEITDISGDYYVCVQPAKNTIEYIIFVYDNYFLGQFVYDNYQIINGIYTNFKIDRDFLLDFFTKDYPVFSLQNYYEDGKRSHNYWFSTTKYSKLVRFDVSEIMGKLLRVETDSKYKEQFYKK